MADGNDSLFPPINLGSSSGIFASNDRPITMHGSRPIKLPIPRTQRARTARYGSRPRRGKLERAPGSRQAQRARQRSKWDLPPKIETAHGDLSWEEEPCGINTKPRDSNKKNETAKRKGTGVDVKRIYRTGLSQGDYDRLLNMKIKQKPRQSQSHSLKLPTISNEENRIRTEQVEKREHKVKLNKIIKGIEEGSTVNLPPIYRNINFKPINLTRHSTREPRQSKEVLINKATRDRFQQRDGIFKNNYTKYIMVERAKGRKTVASKIKKKGKEMRSESHAGKHLQGAQRDPIAKSSGDDKIAPRIQDPLSSKRNVPHKTEEVENTSTQRSKKVQNSGGSDAGGVDSGRTDMHGETSLRPVANDTEKNVQINQVLDDRSKKVSIKLNKANLIQTSTNPIHPSNNPTLTLTNSTKTSKTSTKTSRNPTQISMDPTKKSTNRGKASTVPTQTSTNPIKTPMNPNQTSMKPTPDLSNQTEAMNSQIKTEALEVVEKKFKHLEKTVVQPIEERFDRIEESAKKHRKEIDENTEQILSMLETTMRLVKKTETKFSVIEKKSENVDILERTLHELETNLTEMNTAEQEQNIELVEEQLSMWDARLRRVRKSAGLTRQNTTATSNDSIVNEEPVTSLSLEPQPNTWAYRLNDELSDEDKKAIQRKFYHLKDKLDPDEVIDILFSAEIISSAKLEKIRAEKLPSQKNALVLDLVRKGTYKHLAIFKEALHTSHQAHLVRLLP